MIITPVSLYFSLIPLFGCTEQFESNKIYTPSKFFYIAIQLPLLSLLFFVLPLSLYLSTLSRLCLFDVCSTNYLSVLPPLYCSIFLLFKSQSQHFRFSFVAVSLFVSPRWVFLSRQTPKHIDANARMPLPG